MAGSILVVGLAGRTTSSEWSNLFAGREVVARHRDVVERLLPPTISIAHAYDDQFEDSTLDSIEETIAYDVVDRSKRANIAFLVPGPGWIGDAAVAKLATITEIAFAPFTAQIALNGQTQIIDALLLAQAEEQAPFDAGLQPLDPTSPAEIFNLYGRRVVDLASKRLRQIYGPSHVGEPDTNGTLHIDARDPLDAPPSFAALEHIIARMRRSDGCPWDRKQTNDSMLDDFASEVAEYAEAVGEADWTHAAEELGDVLLHVVMQAQIGIEAGHFRMDDVLSSINAKLVRRHPHVFAGVEAQTPEDVLAVWNKVKAQERSASPDVS